MNTNFKYTIVNKNNQVFLNDDSKTLTLEKTLNIPLFDDVQSLTYAIINTFIVPDDILSNISFSLYDTTINKKVNQKFFITKNQNYDNKLKLVDNDNFRLKNFLSEKRAARIYLQNVEMSLTDPKVEKLFILALSKTESQNIKVGDTIILCSNIFKRVYFKIPKLEVIDLPNLELLFENQDVDLNKYNYFVVLSN